MVLKSVKSVQLVGYNDSLLELNISYIASACECIFTTLHVMQTRYCDENSVCPSVRPSVKRVLCDKNIERSVQIYIPYERTFILVF